jgi:6-phosphofructokinase 1
MDTFTNRTINDFVVPSLGECSFPSPLQEAMFFGQDHQQIILDVTGTNTSCTAELSHPHRKLFFDPKKTKVGMVSCGGLCPGKARYLVHQEQRKRLVLEVFPTREE